MPGREREASATEAPTAIGHIEPSASLIVTAQMPCSDSEQCWACGQSVGASAIEQILPAHADPLRHHQLLGVKNRSLPAAINKVGFADDGAMMGIQGSSESVTPSGAEQAPTSIPAPLLRDYRHIGGIESIEIDGTRYFFGYDFSEDLVLSPLINDNELMSIFAETHMEQRDGLRDRKYWRDLVDESLEYSGLAESESYSFESEQLRLIITSLKDIAETGVPVPDFNYPYHLRFLLSSAGQWKEQFTATAEGISSIKGAESAAEGTALEQIARDVLRETQRVMNTAGGNWAEVFNALAQ